MTFSRSAILIAVGTAFGLVAGGATVAVAATSSSSTVKVCVTKKNVVRSASASSKCPKKTKKRTINVKGVPGAPGAPGSKGDRGPSAFEAPPAGTTITGGGILNVQVSAGGVVMRSYAPLPFKAATPFKEGTNLFFGGSDTANTPGQVNTTKCAGSAASPTAAPATLCVYPIETTNIADGTGFVYAGSDTFDDAADSAGFYLYSQSNASGSMTYRYVWTYAAA